MSDRRLFRFVHNLRLRWKLLVVVLPLATIPVLVVGTFVGFIATKQAYRGITQTSKDDLEHMAGFAIDLLNSHYQQFEVYQQDRKKNVNRELATLVNLAYNLVESEQRQQRAGRIGLEDAKREARTALKSVNVGETGYLYAMTSTGELAVHVAIEGQNIFDQQDENGRYFIREMCRAARASKPGEVLFIVYPWRNAVLGDKFPRKKAVAYRYFREWDWIVAAGGYLEETYEDLAFEKRSFEQLKESLKSKRVGTSGYIYAMSTKGDLRIHIDREGQNILDERDGDGRYFPRDVREEKRLDPLSLEERRRREAAPEDRALRVLRALGLDRSGGLLRRRVLRRGQPDQGPDFLEHGRADHAAVAWVDGPRLPRLPDSH